VWLSLEENHLLLRPPARRPFSILLDTNEAFVLGGDTSASSGLLQPQSGSPFTNSSFKGNYLGGSIALDNASVLNEVELAVPDGNGNIAFAYNSSGPKGLASNQTLTGATYSPVLTEGPR
jgi:hypothetical protein